MTSERVPPPRSCDACVEPRGQREAVVGEGALPAASLGGDHSVGSRHAAGGLAAAGGGRRGRRSGSRRTATSTRRRRARRGASTGWSPPAALGLAGERFAASTGLTTSGRRRRQGSSLVGTRSLDLGRARALGSAGIRVITMTAIDRIGDRASRCVEALVADRGRAHVDSAHVSARARRRLDPRSRRVSARQCRAAYLPRGRTSRASARPSRGRSTGSNLGARRVSTRVLDRENAQLRRSPSSSPRARSADAIIASGRRKGVPGRLTAPRRPSVPRPSAPGARRPSTVIRSGYPGVGVEHRGGAAPFEIATDMFR